MGVRHHAHSRHGPFMSFSLDHSVTLHNDPMLPPTFYGKGIRDLVFGDPAKSCGVVISSRGPEYYLVPPKGMDMPAPVDLPREWNPGDSPVLPEVETYEEGGLRVRFVDPEKSYVTAEECKAYVAIRLKASEPLACPECGTLNNLTHDEDCAFAAAFDDDGSEDDDPGYTDVQCAAIASAAIKSMRELFSADIAAPAPWVEDWLPLGRGGQRRFFNTLDEYMAARVVWIRMTTREREAHLTARDGLTHKLTEIGRLMARRRKIIAKAKRASPTDSAVGSAIAAMNNLSANRKANDL